MPRLLVLLALTTAAGLAAPALIPTPPAGQQAVFEKLAAKSGFATCEKDAEGNVIFVAFNQLGPQKPFDKSAPGLTDADLSEILRFPKLRGLTLCGQPLSDAAFETLEAFPDLEAVRLANIATAKPEPAATPATSAAFLHLDGMRQLKVLDLTHSFRLDGPDTLSQLQGFPELRELIVDVEIANDPDELLPFIAKSPKIERLKLHRTTLSHDQFSQLLEALPNLRYLEIKPNGNTPGKRWSHESLALLSKHPNIEVLRLIHGDALPLPWESGLEHLVAATNLKAIAFPKPDKGEEDRAVKPEDLEKLKAARPDLLINPTRDQLGALKPKTLNFHWELGPM